MGLTNRLDSTRSFLRHLTVGCLLATTVHEVAQGRIRAWHVVDASLGRPMATAYIKLASAHACRTPHDAAHMALLREYPLDAAPEQKTAAIAVGYRFSITSDERSVLLRIQG